MHHLRGYAYGTITRAELPLRGVFWAFTIGCKPPARWFCEVNYFLSVGGFGIDRKRFMMANV